MTSCSLNYETDSKEMKTPDEQAKEIESEIISCIKHKDKETLKSLFCIYIKNNYSDLDAKIEEIFAFIDGKIISSCDLVSSSCGSFEQKDYGATANVITDKGTIYSITFKGWLTNIKSPDKIGINVLVIKNETLNGASEIRIKSE